MVSEGLAADPDLTVLATSIVPLSLPDEHVVRLDPLLAPSPDVVLAHDLRGAPAVRLLLARIDEVSACGGLRAADVRSAATLAHLLGGLPLSLKLATRRDAPNGRSMRSWTRFSAWILSNCTRRRRLQPEEHRSKNLHTRRSCGPTSS